MRIQRNRLASLQRFMVLRPGLRRYFTIGVVTLSSLMIEQSVRADEKGRRIVNGILQILIESQNQNRRPVQPPPGNIRPRNVGPQLSATRTALTGYRDEAVGLSALLQKDVAGNAGLRSFIGTSLRHHASAQSLAHKSKHIRDHQAIAQEIRELDSDRRVLSWRLRQARGLSQPCRDCLDRLDEFGGRLCEIYKLEPQIDRRALGDNAHSLSIYTRSLIDDIEFELKPSRQRDLFLHESSKARQAASGFGRDVLEGATYGELVESYGEFLSIWNPLVRKLGSFESRYIERTVLRTQEVDQSIHQLLWLPRGIDRQLLQQLAEGIIHEVDRIYDSVTLSVLITIPDAQQVPADASSFYGCCQNFADCVERGEVQDDLVEAYGYLPEAWVAFERHFRNVKHDGLRQSVGRIEERLVALREPLGIPGGFDPTEARERAAALEHLAKHLESDVGVWLDGGKFSQERKELAGLCARFRAASRLLHVGVIQSTREDDVRRLCEDSYGAWSQLHAGIRSCDAPDRDHIDKLLIRISGELVSIEAMFLS